MDESRAHDTEEDNLGSASTLDARGHSSTATDDDDYFRRAASDAERFPFALGDRYTPKQVLGTGATASVWQAFDVHIRRDVALKVFDVGNRSLEQVLAEARAASAVRSRYAVQILDVVQGERPVIVMELVGEYQGHLLQLGLSPDRTHPSNVREAVVWCIDAARGVHDAHLRAICHRDIKPRNILITPVTRRARVTDFGLAIAGVNTEAQSQATVSIQFEDSGRPLQVAGTPAYMAPEQAAGVPVGLDMHFAADRRVLVAMDVFGLGALGYDLLVGRAPYAPVDGEDTLDVFDRARDCRRESLRHVQTRWGGRVPRRLANVFEKAMAPSPGNRYETPLELADDLKRFNSRQATTLDGGLTRGMLWIRRNPAVAGSVLAIATTAFLLAAAYDERDALRTQAATLNNQVIKLSRESDNLVSKNEELAQEQDKLESQNRSIAAEKDQAERDYEEWRRRSDDDVRRKAQALKSELRAIKKTLESVALERDSVKQTVPVLQAQLKSAQTQLESVRTLNGIMARQSEQAARARDDAQAEVERLNAALRSTQNGDVGGAVNAPGQGVDLTQSAPTAQR